MVKVSLPKQRSERSEEVSHGYLGEEGKARSKTLMGGFKEKLGGCGCHRWRKGFSKGRF